MATERASLGFGQRLVLLAAWLVSCGFVYVLGVYVGKGMHDRGPVSPGVSLPVDATVPPAPPADAQAPLTFYDVLGTQQGVPGGARPSPPDTPAAPRPARPGAIDEQRLATAPATPPAPPPAPPGHAAAPTPPAVPSARPAAAPATPPARAVPSAPAARPADGTAPPLAAVKPPLAAKPASPPPAAPAMPDAAAPSPVRAAAPAPPAPAGPGLPPQTASGRWTVYANPSRDKLAVEHERAALRAKGYPAEVVTMRRDGDTWYRIRVGRYASEAQAQEASRKLRSDGVGHAFVQSE